MNLTPEDQAAIQKALGRVEKRASDWRKSRWILLVLGLLFIGMGAMYLWLISRIGELHESLASAIRPHAPTTMDLAIMRLRILVEVMMWAWSMAKIGMGSVFIAIAQTRWHKGEDDAALAKLARAVLAKLDESAENTAQQPPSA